MLNTLQLIDKLAKFHDEQKTNLNEDASKLLNNLEKFHLVVSDREDIGQVKVALVPEIIMDQINAYILKNP